jgi:hypothetical protein
MIHPFPFDIPVFVSVQLKNVKVKTEEVFFRPFPSVFTPSHEDVEGDFWTRSWLASLVLLPSANFWIFGADHPRWSLFSYDELLTLGRLGLRWPNQDLLPLELDRVHVNLERIFVKLHLRIFSKFQLSFVYSRLNLIISRIS